MKSYPSIPRATGQSFREFSAFVFDKIDGSNLRFEWSRKQDWGKYGTRNRLFDETDEVFGPAIPLFLETLAEPIERVARKERWERLVAFAEFWGPGSFAGLHVPEDPKTLTLFDLAPYKKGLLGPREFLELFRRPGPGGLGYPQLPRYLGNHNWTRAFVEAVRRNDLEGITLEGVVGKAGEGHHLVMAKAKTQAWIDMVLARYGEAEGRKLVES